MARAVGVLGTGTMGAGIVQVAAQAGYTVVACDPSVEALEKAQLYVRDGLGRSARKGLLSEEEAETAYDRVRWKSSLEELAGCEAVIRGYSRARRTQERGLRSSRRVAGGGRPDPDHHLLHLHHRPCLRHPAPR